MRVGVSRLEKARKRAREPVVGEGICFLNCIYLVPLRDSHEMLDDIVNITLVSGDNSRGIKTYIYCIARVLRWRYAVLAHI